MESQLLLSEKALGKFKAEANHNRAVAKWEASIIWLLIRMRIFLLACIILKKPSLVLQTFDAMLRMRSNVWGGDLKKLYRIRGRYYFNQYTPGWPSAAYDQLIKSELKRKLNPSGRERLSFVFFAITRKCPLRCAHCFEWNNLNKKETADLEELKQVADLYHKEGALQLHFSGGEPMVRIKDLLQLVAYAAPRMECWVLSSGFNVTEQNARALAAAGCRGMVISIDHYLPHMHDAFRGKKASFEAAVSAVKAAQKAGLVTAISICATREFLDGNHLAPYMDFAHSLGVQFVQVLEPRDIGHYAGKEVLLDEHHIRLLEQHFLKYNHRQEYHSYPTLLYHGFHQRRVGCFSGSRSIYIDAAGDVHACPFCHTRSYNIYELLRAGHKSIPLKENACPRFGKIA